MEQYILQLKKLTSSFSYHEFISLLKQIDSEIVNGKIKYLNSEFIYYINQIFSMVNDNYLVDGKPGTLGHMLIENALLEKKKITPTLAMAFFLEQKNNIGCDDVFNNISFYERKNCTMFIYDEKNVFNINWKIQDIFGEDIDRYNYEIMMIILHEVTHVYQSTRKEDTESIFDRLFFYDYQQLKNLQNGMDYSSSLLMHNSFLSEFMADENAYVFMLYLAQQHPEYFNENLIQEKLSDYQARKNGGYGIYGANPRQAETKLIQETKEVLEDVKENYEQAVRDMGIDHVAWIINTDEKILTKAQEIDMKRQPLIEQLQMQGISEKGNDSYYNIFLQTLYHFNGQSIILNNEIIKHEIPR